MTNQRQSEAAAEWEATEKALEAAYALLDAARERANKDQENESKLIDTIKLQADALARQKSTLRRVLEYLLLMVSLGLALQLLYIGNELRILLR